MCVCLLLCCTVLRRSRQMVMIRTVPRRQRTSCSPSTHKVKHSHEQLTHTRLKTQQRTANKTQHKPSHGETLINPFLTGSEPVHTGLNWFETGFAVTRLHFDLNLCSCWSPDSLVCLVMSDPVWNKVLELHSVLADVTCPVLCTVLPLRCPPVTPTRQHWPVS